MKCTLLLPALLVALCLPALAQEKPPQVKVEVIDVKGTIVDASGAPVEGIAVCDQWSYDGQWKPGAGAAKSGAEGRFTLKLRTFPDQPGRAYRIQACDEKRAALFVAKREAFNAEINLSLAALGKVSAKVVGAEGFEPADGGYVNVYTKANNIWMASTQIKDRAFALNLPQGEYSLLLSAGDDFGYVRKGFSAGEKETQLEIRLELTPIAKLYGKAPPPIKISHVRNLPKELEEKGAGVTLADFKGRWVLIEFWGFW